MGHLTHLQNLSAFRWLEWLAVTHQARHWPCLQSCHRWCATPVPWVGWDPGYVGADLLFKVTPGLEGHKPAGAIAVLSPSSPGPGSMSPHSSESSGCSSQLLQLSPTPCPAGSTCPVPCCHWDWAVQAKEVMQLGTTELINLRGNGGFPWCKLQVLHTVYHKIPIVCNDVGWTEHCLDGLVELGCCFPHNMGRMSSTKHFYAR